MLSRLKTRLENLTPFQALFFLAPLLGELVSGYLSPLEFFNPLILIITIMPYGCGAVIVRELVVRFRKGWISLVLLALAFGLFFEGIVTRVLFNPNWEDLGALGEYTHIHGFNWTLAVGIVHFQATISIICAIFITEMVYPDQCHQSWISTSRLIRCGLVLPGWTFVIGIFVPFMPPLVGTLLLIGVVTLLIVLALMLPEQPFIPRSHIRAAPLVFGLVGGIAMTLIMVGTFMIPEFKNRPPVEVTFVALLFLMITEFGILTWLNQGGTAWNNSHRLALVTGFLAFFLGFAILQDLESVTGRSLVSLVAIWQLRRLWLTITVPSNSITVPTSASP